MVGLFDSLWLYVGRHISDALQETHQRRVVGATHRTPRLLFRCIFLAWHTCGSISREDGALLCWRKGIHHFPSHEARRIVRICPSVESSSTFMVVLRARFLEKRPHTKYSTLYVDMSPSAFLSKTSDAMPFSHLAFAFFQSSMCYCPAPTRCA